MVCSPARHFWALLIMKHKTIHIDVKQHNFMLSRTDILISCCFCFKWIAYLQRGINTNCSFVCASLPKSYLVLFCRSLRLDGGELSSSSWFRKCILQWKVILCRCRQPPELFLFHIVCSYLCHYFFCRRMCSFYFVGTYVT